MKELESELKKKAENYKNEKRQKQIEYQLAEEKKKKEEKKIQRQETRAKRCEKIESSIINILKSLQFVKRKREKTLATAQEYSFCQELYNSFMNIDYKTFMGTKQEYVGEDGVKSTIIFTELGPIIKHESEDKDFTNVNYEGFLFSKTMEGEYIYLGKYANITHKIAKPEYLKNHPRKYEDVRQVVPKEFYVGFTTDGTEYRYIESAKCDMYGEYIVWDDECRCSATTHYGKISDEAYVINKDLLFEERPYNVNGTTTNILKLKKKTNHHKKYMTVYKDEEPNHRTFSELKWFFNNQSQLIEEKTQTGAQPGDDNN